jgi:uncharacterized protein DUF2017
MARAFRHTRDGAVARFSADEAVVLADLFGQLLGMLDASDDGPPADADRDPLVDLTGLVDPEVTPTRSTDPVLARLFPDGYRDEPELAAEFRRFTEAELRAGKTTAARVALASLAPVLDAGGRIALDETAVSAWLGALNDLRLTLGTRLQVTADTYETYAELLEERPDDPRTVGLSLYIWLGYLQESLIDAVS